MKFDYFDALERLAVKVCRGEGNIDAEANELIHHLAVDFITPIDRADIAEVTLSLRRCAEAVRRCEMTKNRRLSELCEAVVEYTRALRKLGKKGGVISAKLYLERSREADRSLKNADEKLCAEALCRCCETLIRVAMNNI